MGIMENNIETTVKYVEAITFLRKGYRIQEHFEYKFFKFSLGPKHCMELKEERRASTLGRRHDNTCNHA